MNAHINPQQHVRNIDNGEYFIVQYHPDIPDIKVTPKKVFPMLYSSERMRMVFSRPPDVSFCQPKDLCQHLRRAKLQEPQKEAIHCKPCHENWCQLCTVFISVNCVTSASIGRSFLCRNQGANLNSKLTVYMMCDVCGMQYVGQTGNVRLRKNEHNSDCRRFFNGDFCKSDFCFLPPFAIIEFSNFQVLISGSS